MGAKDLFTPLIDVKHQSDNTGYTSPGNWSPASTVQQVSSQLPIQSELNVKLLAI